MKTVKIGEKEFWAGFLERKTRPLNDEESQMFLNLMLMEMKEKDKSSAYLTGALAGKFPWEVFKKRIDHVKLNVDMHLATWVLCLCDRPALVVMWAYTLNLIRCLDKLEVVTLNDWVRHFPRGVPEDYEPIWDEQKVKPEGFSSDNAVDNFDNWPRLV